MSRLHEILLDLHEKSADREEATVEYSSRGRLFSELAAPLILNAKKRRKTWNSSLTRLSFQYDILSTEIKENESAGKENESTGTVDATASSKADEQNDERGTSVEKKQETCVVSDEIEKKDSDQKKKGDESPEASLESTSTQSFSSRVQTVLETYNSTDNPLRYNFLREAPSTHHKIDIYTSNLTDVTSKVDELRRVYLYGLQQVSELQDLQKAPDAIMPGNFARPVKDGSV